VGFGIMFTRRQRGLVSTIDANNLCSEFAQGGFSRAADLAVKVNHRTATGSLSTPGHRSTMVTISSSGDGDIGRWGIE
jgi:hypothetical protein